MVPVTKAADEFHVSERTLYRLLAAGSLKRYKQVGDRKVYVDRVAVRKALRPRVVK